MSLIFADSDYFFDLAGRYPLLTACEEIELGRKIQRWLQDPDPAPHIIRSGTRARERFVMCNLRLVIMVAKKYKTRLCETTMTFSDILQEGTIGLQRAAEKYDPECGYKMSTYAYWWIKQRINRAIFMQTGLIKIPYDARVKYKRFLDAVEHGGTLQEIMDRAKVTAKDLKIIEQADICNKVVCLDNYDRLEL